MTTPVWLRTAWAWLKVYWKWLLFPIGMLLYLVGRASAKTNVTVVSPSLVAHEEVITKLDAEAAEKKQAADATATQELAAIETHRAVVADAETKKQIAEIQAAEGDPQKTTELLKKIGKDIRSR